MKKLRNLLMMLVLTVICVFGTKYNVNAKETNVKPLKVNKTYYYNLDQKGEKEKIKVVQKEDDDLTEYITLYINNKVVISKIETGSVFVIDSNKKDKQMEIITAVDVDNSELSQINYYRYSGGKLKKVQNLDSLIMKKHKSTYSMIHYFTEKTIFKLDSKGNFMYKMCLGLNSGIDAVHFKDALVLKKGKFVNSNKKNFALMDEKWDYAAKGTNKVYKKPGSSKVVFTLKNKEKFYAKNIYIKSKKTFYLKIKSKKTGKTGYVKANKLKAYLNYCKHA